MLTCAFFRLLLAINTAGINSGTGYLGKSVSAAREERAAILVSQVKVGMSEKEVEILFRKESPPVIAAFGSRPMNCYYYDKLGVRIQFDMSGLVADVERTIFRRRTEPCLWPY